MAAYHYHAVVSSESLETLPGQARVCDRRRTKTEEKAKGTEGEVDFFSANKIQKVAGK
jgi:hypothetical protein